MYECIMYQYKAAQSYLDVLCIYIKHLILICIMYLHRASHSY